MLEGNKKYQLALALLLLFCAAWDLRAVLADQRPGATVSDTTLVDLLELQKLVSQQGVVAWIAAGSVKGPLAGLLAAGLAPLVGDPLLAARLVGVLLHGLLLWLVYRFGARLTGRPATGLLAALICGTFPMQYGWFRLDFHDPLLAVVVLATLWSLSGEPLRSPAAGARLGLLAGLGLLSKLAYPLFVLLPGVYLLATRARGRRALLNLLLALGVAALAVLWWLVPSWAQVSRNLADSSHSSLSLPARLEMYLLDLPGVLPLLLAALAGGLWAWRARAAPARALGLLALGLAGSLLPLLLLFDLWSRYLLPLFPLAALLAACGLTALGQALTRAGGPRLTWALAAALTLALLAQYVALNLRGLDSRSEAREFYAGMLAPDLRPYRAYPRAVAEVRRRGLPLIELISGPNPQAFPALWEARGHRLPTEHPDDARERLRRGRPVYLLYSTTQQDPLAALAAEIRDQLQGREPAPAPAPGFEDPARRFPRHHQQVDDEAARVMAFLAPLARRVIWSRRDPDGVAQAIIRLDLKRGAATAR